ncbi:MAG: GNAT family N-acetyltransferase [Sedimentisphaerales bacterium]
MQKDNFQITFASLDDLEKIVALHLRCFSKDDNIAVLFGKDFLRAAYKWFIIDTETYVLVAKQDNLLVGYTAVADKSYSSPMLRANKWEVLHALIRRPWLALRPELLLRLFRLAFPKRKYHLVGKVAQVAFTAVEPQFRRLGIGKALKKETIRVCRERGMTGIVTGVRRKNLRGKALNESAGFVEVPELSTRGLCYLRLDLDQFDESSL